MTRKITFFISTVSAEFRGYRDRLRTLMTNRGFSVATQEDFELDGADLLRALDEQIQAADAVVHLLGDRAGALASQEAAEAILQDHPDLAALAPLADAGAAQGRRFSYTQWEAYLAHWRDKRLFVCQATPDAARERYGADNPAPGAAQAGAERADQAAHLERLKALGRYPGLHFASPAELAAGVAFSEPFRDMLLAIDARPSFRPELERLPQTFVTKLVGRREEQAILREAWADPETRVIALDALGGAGKTALARGFANDMLAAPDHFGADAAFAWSFDGQGSDEDRQSSADEFFREAFRFFGAGEPPLDPREKGVKLAEALAQTRALLVLDGLEPLQYAARPARRQGDASRIVGGIKDPGVKALVQRLADANSGLVVVTTRVAVSELQDRRGARRLAVAPLTLMAGIALLRALGLAPGRDADAPPPRARFPKRLAKTLPADYAAKPSEPARYLPASVAADLAGAVASLSGHALALTVYGKFVAEHCGGDLRRLGALPALEDLGAMGLSRHRDPFRAMRAVETAFLRELAGVKQLDADGLSGAAEGQQLALLFFLGLFDRPADRDLLSVVFPADGALAPSEADLSLIGSAPKGMLGDLSKRLAGAARRGAEDAPLREARRRVILRRLAGGLHGALLAEPDGTALNHTLGRLADLGLVDRPPKGRIWQEVDISCHPLARAYFDQRLKALDPELYRRLQSALYDHQRFQGLPEAFQEPVAYAALALSAGLPDQPLARLLEEHAAGETPDETLQTWPPTLRDADPDALRRAAALVDGEAWRAAMAAFQPDSARGMAPLFAAIRHGCEADRDDEAFFEVYWPRIARADVYDASRTLGLYGQELAALASFFETPFSAPSRRLSAHIQALLLDLAGLRLRALGRLSDAASTISAAVDARVAQNDWDGAAADLGDLAALRVSLGRLAGAEGARATADAARQHAAKIDGDSALFRRMAAESRLQEAALALGDLPGAEAAALAVEAFQKDLPPTHPRLHSARGYGDADLLLARGQADEVEQRYRWRVSVRQAEPTPLANALEELAHARAVLAVALGAVDAGGSLDASERIRGAADAALAALRRANTENHLPSGLLHAADVSARAGDAEAAAALIREAEDSVERGPAPLFHADLHLLRARIALWDGAPAAASGFADAAEALIEAHAYAKARPALAVLRAEISGQDADIAAAAQAIRGDASLPQTQEHGFGDGWWGLLPRFRALVAERPAFADALAGLEAAARAYQAARAHWLDETGGIPGAKTARQTSPGGAAGAGAPAPEAGSPNTAAAVPRAADGVPDALLDQIVEEALSRESTRRRIDAVAKKNNLPGSPADQPAAVKRAIARWLINEGHVAIQRDAVAGPAAGDSAPARPRKSDGVADATLDAIAARMIGEPRFDGLLREILRMNDLSGAPADQPADVRRNIARALIDTGRVDLSPAPAEKAAQEAAKEPAKAPAKARAKEPAKEPAKTPAKTPAEAPRETLSAPPAPPLKPEPERKPEPKPETQPQSGPQSGPEPAAASGSQPRTAPPALPDAALDQLAASIFADPRAQPALTRLMSERSLPGAPQDLPPETKRSLVALLIERGVITLQSSAAPGAEPSD